MPNYVRNKVYFYGSPERNNKLRGFVNGESCFDFNEIVPMSKDLDIPHGSEDTIAKACARARQKGETTCKEYKELSWAHTKSFDSWADLGDKYLNNMRKYGSETWYDWRINNWGTKWNSIEPIWEGDNFVSFDTAWSAPEEIFVKLAEIFPDIHFTVMFADEDLGNNCGTIEYEGEGVSTVYEDTLEFACDVWGYNVDEIREEQMEEV